MCGALHDVVEIMRVFREHAVKTPGE